MNILKPIRIDGEDVIVQLPHGGEVTKEMYEDENGTYFMGFGFVANYIPQHILDGKPPHGDDVVLEDMKIIQFDIIKSKRYPLKSSAHIIHPNDKSISVMGLKLPIKTYKSITKPSMQQIKMWHKLNNKQW